MNVCRPLVLAALLAPLVATAADDARRRSANDPLEGWNRGVYAFNEKLDEHVLEPVAKGYRNVVPRPVRLGVSNFFGNFGDAWSAVNQFLQGKPQQGLEMTMRVATNSVFGLGGLLDVASEAGLERQSEDFGQTLGVWGLGAGPYLVWPLLGPSSLRETAALPLDRGWSPALAFSDGSDALAITTLNVIDTRASLLGASQLLDQIAFDKYSFVRDAYLARRRSLVYDGQPPEDTFDDNSTPDAGEPAPGTTR